jgi:hypothetical protein
LLMMVIGNLLPKMRPLHACGGAAAAASRAERFAGWILVLAGIADLVLFTSAPLESARLFSAIIGLGAIAVIALDRGWLALTAEGARDANDGVRSAQKRELTVGLMFGFLYVVGTACVVSLFDVANWSSGATRINRP